MHASFTSMLTTIFPTALFTAGVILLGSAITAQSVFADDAELVRCPDSSAVYRIEDDGQRHAFPNERIYFSWYADFSEVETVPCNELADLMLGSNVTYQAGTRLVKMPSVATVYAVEPEGILRPIPSEDYAATVWGDAWALRVDDMSEAFFPSYEVDEALEGDELPNGTILVEDGLYYQLQDGDYTEIDDELLAQHAIPYANAWDLTQDRAFATTSCANEGRDFADDHYTGPLYDTHIHMPAIPETPGLNESAEDYGDDNFALGINFTIDDIACTFQTEGTGKVFGFFSVWDGGMTEPMVETARRAAEAHPDLFVPFIMPPQNDDRPDGYPTVDAETLESMLAVSPGTFPGYGEIGLYARNNGGSPELPPDDPRMLEIYDSLVERGISLVYVHLGVGHQDNFERAAGLYPELNFIFHGDQLVVYEQGGYQNLEAVDEILDNHANVYYGVDELYGDDFLLRPEVSKEEFFAHFEDYEPLLDEDIATWGEFITEHSTQVLWGTDRGWSSAWSLDIETGLLLTDYARAFIGRLPEDVQENYAYKNAQRLLE